ncbi:MAG: hypothetical protein HYX76_03895 [Acidobacteria bacterium]|nr:hypothetical protein [Acidobacteriota bacterium]
MRFGRIPARARWPVTAAAVVVALSVAGCGVTSTSRRPLPQPTRARAFVDTFDRILIAGFVAGHVSDRGHDLDINEETARLLRMTLRSKGGLDVIESQPLALRRSESEANTEDAIFTDVPFWRRLAEEYREPLILTGAVIFKGAGSQYEERTMGRRTMRLWRPGFSLNLRLVFISGRTGEMLDSLSLGPVTGRASDARTSALALYFGLMERLTPSVLAACGAGASEQRQPYAIGRRRLARWRGAS